MNKPLITEEEEHKRGEKIVEMLNMKEAKYGDHPRRLRSYTPPRYFTQWGTKTALGIYRSLARLVNEGTAD